MDSQGTPAKKGSFLSDVEESDAGRDSHRRGRRNRGYKADMKQSFQFLTKGVLRSFTVLRISPALLHGVGDSLPGSRGRIWSMQ